MLLQRGVAVCLPPVREPPLWLVSCTCRKNGPATGSAVEVAGIAAEETFATKGEMAQRMLARTLAPDVPAGWVVRDTADGSEQARSWLEEQERSCVLAMPETHTVWSAGLAQRVWPVGRGALFPGDLDGPLRRRGPSRAMPRRVGLARAVGERRRTDARV